MGQSGRASQIVADAFPDESSSEQVLVQSKSTDARSPQFKAAVSDVVHRLQATKGVEQIESPYSSGGQISADRHSALVTYELPGDSATVTVLNGGQCNVDIRGA